MDTNADLELEIVEVENMIDFIQDTIRQLSEIRRAEKHSPLDFADQKHIDETTSMLSTLQAKYKIHINEIQESTAHANMPQTS